MEKLRTVNIKGKEYVEVNERIRHFREHYKDWSLTSEIVEMANGVVTFKAIVKDENDRVIATGYAQEKEGSTFINKTSYIENCETSAWGRALGNLGIGVDTSIASSDEVENAIANQQKYETKSFGNVTEEEATELAIKKGLASVLKKLNNDYQDIKAQVQKSICEKYNVDKWSDIRFDDYTKFGLEVKEEIDRLKEESEVNL